MTDESLPFNIQSSSKYPSQSSSQTPNFTVDDFQDYEYYADKINECKLSYPDKLFNIQYELSRILSSPELNTSLSDLIKFVYNPFTYAGNIHLTFLNKFINSNKRLVFLGMNPGPWGMMQTGIPFGEVKVVQDWLGISGSVHPPEVQHPSKPVQGFNCKRSEVSGKRFWALAKDISRNNPLLFFKNTFVYNYYPLGLLSESGKNLTPTDLKANERKKLFGPCDAALCDIVELLQVEVIVAIGRFAEQRAKQALKQDYSHVNVVFISHPSPRNAKSNKNWHDSTIARLGELDLMKYFS